MQLVKAEPVTPTAVPCKSQTTRQKVWAILPWVIFGMACVWAVVSLIIHYTDGLTAEMSAELILAKLLAEGKGFIVTDQWCYSTELRFLNTQLIFTPLFWLFDNWQVVHIIGTLLWYGVMLGTFYFMLASLRQKRLFPWLATFLLLPVNGQWRNFVISFGCYYIPHIAISFTVLGLTFYALRAVSKKNFWLLTGGGGHFVLAVSNWWFPPSSSTQYTVMPNRSCLLVNEPQPRK